jgi:hypothetical protein
MRAKTNKSDSHVLSLSLAGTGTGTGNGSSGVPRPRPFFPGRSPGRPRRPSRSPTAALPPIDIVAGDGGAGDGAGGGAPPAISTASVVFDGLSTCQANTPLTNGENLFVTLDLENAFSSGATLDNFLGQTGLVNGNGFVNPFVHISYVIDISGSTADDCDGNRTILQCETDAILTLDGLVEAAGVTVDVSLTSFASFTFPADLDPATPGVQLLAVPGDPGLLDALSALASAGGTAYQNATRAAIDAITISVQNPVVTQTFLVFLSDGSENNPGDLRPEVAALNALGTTVYTFAVGEGLECQGNLFALARDTGGSCTEVAGAFELNGVLRDIVIPNRELAATQITLNGAPLSFSSSPPIPTDGQFVGDGPFDISGDAVTLDAGSYEVCLASASSGFDGVACCVNFEVL